MLLEGSFNYPAAARLQPEAQKPTQKLFKKSASERASVCAARLITPLFMLCVSGVH